MCNWILDTAADALYSCAEKARAGSMTAHSRLCFIIWATLLWSWMASGQSAGAAVSASRPNIVFLLADDLGYGDVGCFGSKDIRTPHLDRLATRGLKLTHFYSPAPVCSPSRAGFLTGRTPNRCGIYDWIPLNSGIHLSRSEISVAKLLKKAGYRTAHIGKWHLNSKWDGDEPTPGDHGFDHWMATQNNADPSHENPTNFIRNGERVGRLQGNSSTLIVDEAIRFLSTGKREPFLLFAWFHAPHEPVAVPNAYADMYKQLDDPTKRQYCGCVTLMDREIGRLLAVLDEMKLSDTTLVFFSSDNGPETLRRYGHAAARSHGSPGPLRGMKLHMHEAGYRVPAILAWPRKIVPGRTSTEPISGVDLLPTLCDLAGAGLPTNVTLDGVSIRPVLEGRAMQRTKPLYWQYDRAIGGPWKVALRDGPWKLLSDAKLQKFALYDLTRDESEQNDLAARESDRVRVLSALMRRMHADVNAPRKP